MSVVTGVSSLSSVSVKKLILSTLLLSVWVPKPDNECVYIEAARWLACEFNQETAVSLKLCHCLVV